MHLCSPSCVSHRSTAVTTHVRALRPPPNASVHTPFLRTTHCCSCDTHPHPHTSHSSPRSTPASGLPAPEQPPFLSTRPGPWSKPTHLPSSSPLVLYAKGNLIKDSLEPCSGFNKDSPCQLIYLNALSPVSGTVWENLGGVSLLEEVCH